MVRFRQFVDLAAGSSLFLKMKVEEVLKEHNLEAEFSGRRCSYLCIYSV